MPKTRLTKSTIDALPIPEKEIVHWDQTLPGFGLKITPKGRKVFIVLYRAGGGGSRLRKYTIGPYGRITLHNARIEAQKVLAARLEGRDPATEKLEARRRLTADTVPEVIGLYAKLHLSQRRSGREVMQILQRNLVDRVGSRSVHSISKRDVIDLVNAVVDRGSPVAANKSLKVVKSFFNWCVGRAIVERSPCEGIRVPTVERARDRVLTDRELAEIIRAARQLGGPYGAIVEVLALTGQRRDRSRADELGRGRSRSPGLDVAGHAYEERQAAHCSTLGPGGRGHRRSTTPGPVRILKERRHPGRRLLKPEA